MRNNISRNKYAHYDQITGKILGFYNDNAHPIPEPYILMDEQMYNTYFEGLTNSKEYRVVDDILVESTSANSKISLDDYKALKNARLIYESRIRSSIPFEYEGNFYDVYFLRNNYFDQRFLEEISNDTTNDIKLITINNRMVTMDTKQFLEFYYKYTQYTKAIYNKLLSLLDQVFDAEDSDTVDSVVWNDEINEVIYPKDSIFMPLTDTSNSYINKIRTITINENQESNVDDTLLPDDAPSDNNIYARKNGEWYNITNMFSMGFETPPQDNKLYAMQNGQWVAISNLEVNYQ